MLDLPKKLSSKKPSYSRDDPKQIAALFDSIAKRYDRTNAWLSFGLCTHWSRRLAHLLAKGRPQDFLDLCGGTGEITRQLSRKLLLRRAVIVDFSGGMLEIAKRSSLHAETLQSDVCSIPLEEASFDKAAMAYGIRNIKERSSALKEAFRLLRSGGQFAILELTRPKNRLLRLGHRLYLKFAVPLVGKLSAQSEAAYTYLSKSVEGFIEADRLKLEMEQAGFEEVEAIPLTGGIATIIKGTKP